MYYARQCEYTVVNKGDFCLQGAGNIIEKTYYQEHISMFRFFLKILCFFQTEGKGRRKRGRETSVCGCFSRTPYWGPGPQTQACALTGNPSSDLLVHRLALHLLSHTSQGPFCFYKPLYGHFQGVIQIGFPACRRKWATHKPDKLR